MINEVKKYKRKVPVVEAIQYLVINKDVMLDWIAETENLYDVIDIREDGTFNIKTVYGWRNLEKNQYVVKGVDTDIFVVEAEDFEETFYEV